MKTCPQCKYGMMPEWAKCPECGTKPERKIPTPRTDANDYGWQYHEQYNDFDSLYDDPVQWVDFARTLERENLKLREALQKFYDVNTRYGIGGLGMDEYMDANKTARELLYRDSREPS